MSSLLIRRWSVMAVLGCTAWMGGTSLGAEPFDPGEGEFVFPADAGVIDVSKPPYNANGADDVDDTAAIQKAIDDHPNGNRVIYLPDGTYTITDTLRWGTGGGGRGEKRTILQGQSRKGVILRLPDAAPGFDDAAKPKSMIWTGQKPAQRFRNSIRNLTVNSGRNNPGAIGAQYIANNQGSMRDVSFVSGDGAGAIGLDLGYTDEQGPVLIKNVSVDGFDVGISTRTVVASITMEHVTLRNQRVVGWRNDGQIVSVRGFTFVGVVPAIENLSVNGLVTLIDADINAKTPQKTPAITNGGAMLLRNANVTGFTVAVENTTKQGTGEKCPIGKTTEWVSHAPYQAFQASRTTGLNLPVKETPLAPYPPLDTWAGPHQFGGSSDDDLDDTDAVQKAVDSGARVLYFPQGGKKAWRIDGEVMVRGRVARITCLEGRLAGAGRFRILDGDAPGVVIDRIDLIYQKIGFVHATKRPVTFSGITFGGGVSDEGTGDLFFEDVCLGQIELKGGNVWMRQFNPEAKQRKILNEGGTLWIMGLKTEQAGTVVETTDGGMTEILGGFIYAQGAEKTTPMFVVKNAQMTATVGETSWNKRNFKTILEETRSGQTKDFQYTKDVYWRNNNAAMIPLLIAAPK